MSVSGNYFYCDIKKKVQKPDIILIFTGDPGRSQLGCYGSGYYQTPNRVTDQMVSSIDLPAAILDLIAY